MHARRMEIGDLARAAAGPTWSRLEVRRDQVGAYARTVVTCDGREIPVEGMDEPFQLMRELSYEAGAGTWFTCELEFAAGTRAYAGRVQSAEPPFEEVPPVAALAELTAFPAWSRPPGCRRRCPPPCPSGCPVTTTTTTTGSTPPTTAPAAPAADQRGDVLHAGRGDDGGCAPLPAGPRPPDALPRRAGRRSGVRALLRGPLRPGVLGGAAGHARRRRSGAGTDARRRPAGGGGDDGGADELETETVFTIRLDLPPERIGTLRTVLPGVLGQVESPPELIGF
ncbi:hypothetical protein ACFQYP_25275 [Nonomuraea antimicrobica]